MQQAEKPCWAAILGALLSWLAWILAFAPRFNRIDIAYRSVAKLAPSLVSKLELGYQCESFIVALKVWVSARRV
jgi:hypothetical protein